MIKGTKKQKVCVPISDKPKAKRQRDGAIKARGENGSRFQRASRRNGLHTRGKGRKYREDPNRSKQRTTKNKRAQVLRERSLTLTPAWRCRSKNVVMWARGRNEGAKTREKKKKRHNGDREGPLQGTFQVKVNAGTGLKALGRPRTQARGGDPVGRKYSTGEADLWGPV